MDRHLHERAGHVCKDFVSFPPTSVATIVLILQLSQHLHLIIRLFGVMAHIEQKDFPSNNVLHCKAAPQGSLRLKPCSSIALTYNQAYELGHKSTLVHAVLWYSCIDPEMTLPNRVGLDHSDPKLHQILGANRIWASAI